MNSKFTLIQQIHQMAEFPVNKKKLVVKSEAELEELLAYVTANRYERQRVSENYAEFREDLGLTQLWELKGEIENKINVKSIIYGG